MFFLRVCLNRLTNSTYKTKNISIECWTLWSWRLFDCVFLDQQSNFYLKWQKKKTTTTTSIRLNRISSKENKLPHLQLHGIGVKQKRRVRDRVKNRQQFRKIFNKNPSEYSQSKCLWNFSTSQCACTFFMNGTTSNKNWSMSKSNLTRALKDRHIENVLGGREMEGKIIANKI